VVLTTGILLIIVPLAFNAMFFLLQRRFDYPETLRKPTDEILTRLASGGSSLRLTWYLFAWTALLFIPVPVLVHQVFGTTAPWYLAVGTVLGIVAGVVQLFGLIRWPFVVAGLAASYTAPGATPATQDAIKVVFEALHRYLGVSIGEHLGYMLTGFWSLFLSIAIIQTGVVAPWLGWAGIIPARGVLAGTLEEAGWKPAAMVNAVSYILWSIWLIALGVIVLLSGG
jgi:hypothetical protein